MYKTIYYHYCVGDSIIYGSREVFTTVILCHERRDTCACCFLTINIYMLRIIVWLAIEEKRCVVFALR